MSAKRIAALADKLSGERTRVWLLERSDGAPTSISRVGGLPVGVKDWPRTPDGTPMEHILTIAARDLGAGDVHGVAAFAVFVSSTEMNEAWEPDTDESAVVLLDEKDLERGEWKGAPPPRLLEACGIEVTALDVPLAAFHSDHEEVRDLIFAAAGRVGGPIIWMQGEEHDEPMLAQFDEALVPMNLGDAGVMYVFRDTAFWQCA